MQARAAGYRAGYALVADFESLEKNPQTDVIIDLIRTWEEAKALGIFTGEQRARLKDPERDFHLEKTGSNRWELRNYDKFPFEHRKKTLQPAEPTHSEWVFENAADPQPLHLHLLMTGADALVENLEIEVDRFFKVTIPASLKKGQSLVWDGSDRVKLYDDQGRSIGGIALPKGLPLLQRGKHSMTVDARFIGGAEPILKGTVKLKGRIEVIDH
jgi:hypothetical protein